MKISFCLLLFLVGLIASCEDTGPINNVSKCIDSKIEMYPPDCGAEVGTTVDEYLFQDKLVYVFEYSQCCCDYQSPVLNADCDTLGYLNGFIGNYTINGESFENAEFLRTVWP